jgi:hypothetical protein
MMFHLLHHHMLLNQIVEAHDGHMDVKKQTILIPPKVNYQNGGKSLVHLGDSFPSLFCQRHAVD